VSTENRAEYLLRKRCEITEELLACVDGGDADQSRIAELGHRLWMIEENIIVDVNLMN
jgi:hypothetical protein